MCIRDSCRRGRPRARRCNPRGQPSPGRKCGEVRQRSPRLACGQRHPAPRLVKWRRELSRPPSRPERRQRHVINKPRRPPESPTSSAAFLFVRCYFERVEFARKIDERLSTSGRTLGRLSGASRIHSSIASENPGEEEAHGYVESRPRRQSTVQSFPIEG